MMGARMRMPRSLFLTLRPSWFHAYTGGVGSLPCNLQNVAKAVIVKAAHCVEVGGECIGVSCLQLLDKALDIGGDNFLCCLRLSLAVVAASGSVVHGVGSLAFCFSCRPGMYLHTERLLAKWEATRRTVSINGVFMRRVKTESPQLHQLALMFPLQTPVGDSDQHGH